MQGRRSFEKTFAHSVVQLVIADFLYNPAFFSLKRIFYVLNCHRLREHSFGRSFAGLSAQLLVKACPVSSACSILCLVKF